jgi:hypothetical protein
MTPTQREHLELIRQTTGDLRPEDVLDDARNPNSPLHSCFTWDDSVAAEAYRLTQAKAVIRVAIRYLSRPSSEPQRVRIKVEETKSAPVAPDTDRTEELFSNTLREAEIAVLINSLRLEAEHLTRTMSEERREEFATERLAISMFVRGVPMSDIVECCNASDQDGVIHSELDVARWTRQWGGQRPARWSADLARRQWDADESADRSSVFGVPPFGQRHPRYPDRKVGT